MISSNNEPLSTRWIHLDDDFNWNDLDKYGQNLEDESQLHKPFGFMKFFTDPDECVDYITNIHNDQIIFTVCGRFARHVVPHIHGFPQLAAVYIVCRPENKDRNKEWSKNYCKVRAIVSEAEEYLTIVTRNHIPQRPSFRDVETSTSTNRIRFDAPVTFDIFASTNQTYKSLSIESGNFIWMQLLIEVLLRMGTLGNPINELTQMFYEFIKRDEKDWSQALIVLSVYSSSNPIRWYTKKPFVYAFVNETLRSGDIDKLIKLRILVRDIHNQLKEEQTKFVEPFVVTYRGQAIQSKERENLQQHIGDLISMNSFLSTSKSREVALGFAKAIDENNPNLESVLFEIECSTCKSDAKPFADIRHLSSFEEEEEILFMLGAIFRVLGVYKNQAENVWIVKLVLCGENDHKFRNVFESIKEDMGKIPSLTSLGLLFQKMGDFGRAAKCFQQHLNLLEPDDDMTRSACYQNLGNVAQENGDFEKSLSYLHKALEIRSNLPSVNKPVMSGLHNDIGVTYERLKNYKKALEHFQQALLYVPESVEEDHILFAVIYSNIGSIYRIQEKYDDALSKLNKSLQIRRKLNLANRPDFANALFNIGTVYAVKGEHQKALLYFQEALDIQQKVLPNNNVSLARSYNNIALTYRAIGKIELALENLKMAEEIFRSALPLEHPDLQATIQNIETMERQKP